MPRVAVIGAGVIGLSSALHVLEHCPSVDLTIFADAFSPNTTTNVSAGFWEPHLLGKTPTDLLRKWSGKTLDHMRRLAGSDSAKYTGACNLSGYQLSPDEAVDTPFWSDMVGNFRHLSRQEMNQFPGIRSGFFFTTAILEPGPYLEFLMKRVQRKGAHLKRRRVTSIRELSGEGYDVILNCAGLGARDLVDDQGMQSVRGQLMRVQAPWLKHFIIILGERTDSIVIPSMSYVVLGGTANVDVENTNVSRDDSNRIWNSCVKYCPSLTEAKIESEHVGLRPTRPMTVRLEKETVNIDGKPQIVVHNYGHGGGGVTLHWGCAEDTASLVKQALDTIQPVKSNL